MRVTAVTLADIALEVGVSTATVTRALNARGYVADAVRVEVEKTATRLGYKPNLVARGFRTRRSFTIGHVSQGITDNPFFAHVARSVEQEALAHGYKVFLYNQDGSEAHERIGVERLIERQVDAVIFTYARSVENLERLRRAGVAAVQIERDRSGDTHCVLVDNLVGTVAGVRHLVALGHRRIAFIGGDPGTHPRSFSQERSVEEERLFGFLETLREAGISPDERLISLGGYVTPGERGENLAGVLPMRAMLRSRRRPTAVFTGCDVIAAGALQAIYEARLRVPDDISVVGFDDTLAASLTPMLTTVAQPMAELGRTAISLALDSIEDSDAARRRVVLPTRLVVRRSTGAPPTRVRAMSAGGPAHRA